MNRMGSSRQELDAELHLSRRAHGRPDHAEIGASQLCIRQTERRRQMPSTVAKLLDVVTSMPSQSTSGSAISDIDVALHYASSR